MQLKLLLLVELNTVVVVSNIIIEFVRFYRYRSGPPRQWNFNTTTPVRVRGVDLTLG